MLICLAARSAPHRFRHGVALFFLGGLALLPLAIASGLRWELPVLGSIAFSTVESVESPGAASFAGISLIVWCLGVSFFGTRLLLAIRAVNRLQAAATPVSDRAIIEELQTQFGIRRAVALAWSQELTRPIVCGWRRPMILLPESAREWPEQRLRWVIAHELAHVRRGDLWIQSIGQFLCALHWFNPFAWGLTRVMNREREIAADEWAVAVTGNDRAAYAHDLLCLVKEIRDRDREQVFVKHRSMVTAAMIGATSPKLETRIRGLMSGRRAQTQPGMVLAIAVMGSAAVALFALCCVIEPGPDYGSSNDSETQLRLSADPFPAD